MFGNKDPKELRNIDLLREYEILLETGDLTSSMYNFLDLNAEIIKRMKYGMYR